MSAQQQIEPLPYARSFRELVVYQKARTLAREVFENAGSFCGEEYAPALRETEAPYFTSDFTAEALNTEN